MSADIGTVKHLLVPINVEALAVGRQTTKSGQGWSDLCPDFSRLYEGDILGGQLTPSLDTQSNPQLPAGIHLHWALPDALTHGRQVRSEDGGEPSAPPEFPYIPNRWMVQRISAQADTGNIAVRAWVIESDYLFGKDEAAPDHCVTLPRLDALPLYAHVGKKSDYSDWRESGDTAYKFKLTALGYGDPAFAAYYPACKSLLGFHDELNQVPDNTVLTYMVVGWYSDAARDLLYNGAKPYTPAQWSARLGQLKWSTDPPYPLFRADAQNHCFVISGYGDLSAQFPAGARFEVLDDTPNQGSYTVTGTSYSAPEFAVHVDNVPSDQARGRIAPPRMACPDRTLCHGQVYNIAWQDKQADYTSQVPVLNKNNCRVAVGNSSGEALAALLSDALDHPRAEDLLAAFQGDILAHNTDDRELEALLHQNRFSASSGGRMLGVRKASVEDVRATAGAQDALTGETLGMLDDLNRKEEMLARRERELADYCWELYATWYKQVLAQGADPFAAQIESLKQKIEEQKALIAEESDRIRENRDAFETALGEKFKSLASVAVPAPPFWQANDPVVLVAAEGTRASRRHGHDGRYSDKDELHCRISGQETSAIFVDIPNNQNDVKVEAARTFDIHLDTSGAGPVPMGVRDTLLQECLVLDPSRADRIAEQAYIEAGLSTRPGKAQVLADIAALQRPEAATGQTGARSAGALPSPIARRDWQGNPWLPLFLKWRLVWHSSYDQVPDALANWSFTGDEEDYRFAGEAPRTRNEALYQDYTILTPHALGRFKDAVKAYHRTNRDPALEKILARLGDLNILSQFLGGLGQAFTMRDTVLQIPPIKLPPDQEIIDPIYDRVRDVADASPDPGKPFLPIRAGHAKLIELAVVDAFGQTVTLPRECLDHPVRAANQRINGEEYAPLIEFPPRVARPMRLRFDWPPADNPDNFPKNSPICGWVMPNYLDKSLLFFDACGTGLGAVQKILRQAAAGGTGGAAPEDLKAFFWVPQPGTELHPDQIPNPELKGFVKFLTAMDADTGDAFWRTLDTALGKMDSGVPQDDPLLSVLIGRPLVLVRAALNLELAGLPAFDQALDKVGGFETGGIEQVQFPLLLGDAGKDTDGLLGYFRPGEPSAAGLGPFYPAAGARGPIVDGTLAAADTPLALHCGGALPLTLLMDPLARIHARTGMLPKTYGELPHRWRSAANTVKTAFFQAAPLISPGGDLRLPKPSDDFGKWSWACRPRVTLWKEYATIDPLGDRAGFSPVRQELQEGWLKLKLNPVAILRFGIREGTLGVPPQTNVTLEWLLKGGTRLSLFAGPQGQKPEEEKPELLWERTAPFPEQYRVQVLVDTTYTLRLTDDEGGFSEKQLTITVK